MNGLLMALDGKGSNNKIIVLVSPTKLGDTNTRKIKSSFL